MINRNIGLVSQSQQSTARLLTPKGPQQKPSFWENARHFIKNSSLHGLKYIGDDSLAPLERVFFMTAFICAFSVNIYLVQEVYTKWKTTPVIVSSSPTLTYISEIPFPAITICNMNQALRGEVQHTKPGSIENSFLQTMCARGDHAGPQESKISAANPIDSWHVFRDFLVTNTQPCERMLRFCRIGTHEENCNNIFRPILTDEGNCCTFNTIKPEFMYANKSDLGLFLSNSNPPGVAVDWSAEDGYPKPLPPKFYPIMISSTGIRFGVSFILDAEVKDYYCSSTNSAGFKVAVHTPEETPRIADFAMTVGVGEETSITVRPDMSSASHILVDTDRVYRQCVFQAEGLANLTYFGTYSRKNCELECLAKQTMAECKCIEYFMPRVSHDAEICTIKELECTIAANKKALSNSNAKSEICSEQCLPCCYDLSYTTELISNPITENGSFLLRNHRQLKIFEKGYISENVAIVNIFYHENALRALSKEQFIGLTEFLGNTGGLLGLFLGFSVLSAIEILYYITIRPFLAIKKFGLRQKKNDKPDQTLALINNAKIFITSEYNVEKIQRATPIRYNYYN